jgi:hypothetical protein
LIRCDRQLRYSRPAAKAMKTKTKSSQSSEQDTKNKIIIPTAANPPARHADLAKKRAQAAKASLKGAKKTYKQARKAAEKAVKKARQREEELKVWLKSLEGAEKKAARAPKKARAPKSAPKRRAFRPVRARRHAKPKSAGSLPAPPDAQPPSLGTNSAD